MLTPARRQQAPWPWVCVSPPGKGGSDQLRADSSALFTAAVSSSGHEQSPDGADTAACCCSTLRCCLPNRAPELRAARLRPGPPSFAWMEARMLAKEDGRWLSPEGTQPSSNCRVAFTRHRPCCSASLPPEVSDHPGTTSSPSSCTARILAAGMPIACRWADRREGRKASIGASWALVSSQACSVCTQAVTSVRCSTSTSKLAFPDRPASSLTE